MEIRFADTMSKRWKVLGMHSKGKGKDIPADVPEEDMVVETPTLDGHRNDQELDTINNEVNEIVQHPVSEQEAILAGQLVKIVISHAMTGTSL